MNHQAIVIHDHETEADEYFKLLSSKLPKSKRNVASSSQENVVQRNKVTDHYRETPQQEEEVREEAHYRSEASLEYSINRIEHGLEEIRRLQGELGEATSTSICIYKFPDNLVSVNDKAQQPEIVSIGPYHRGKDHLLKFEQHKWSFLDKLISRTAAFGINLSDYLMEMRALEARTRQCYADVVLMSSHDFVEMMLLDACFVIELLRCLGCSDEVINDDDPIFTRPWLIPILITDLLKLENQLPFFVLESFFKWSRNSEDTKSDDLSPLMLKVFDLAFPRSAETTKPKTALECKNLLDLVHRSLLQPKEGNTIHELDEYRPSNQSIECVTRLRPSGIKFKSTKSDSILDIKYQNRVLKIPTITINDFTSSLLVNLVAWEQCRGSSISKYFTDYISFMNCLIQQPRDVAFLCMDGIITRFSRDDDYVANLFNNLGKSMECNIQNCYLSKEFREVEAYYSSNWANITRTYFSSPWALISVISAFLVILLTIVQTIMSILSYKAQLRYH